MQQIILASSNQGKVAEFQHLFVSHAIEVIPQGEYQVTDAEETGTTFIENALLKARHAAKITGMPVLADDSGLVVDVLNGAPGVLSARYAGAHGNSTANIEKLLKALQGVPQEKRTARYVCLLVYLRHADDPLPIIAQGLWEGVILEEPRGDKGFGFDPVFWLPDTNCAVAELEPIQKNQLSHRAKALRQLMTEWDLMIHEQ